MDLFEIEGPVMADQRPIGGSRAVVPLVTAEFNFGGLAGDPQRASLPIRGYPPVEH